MPIIIYKCPMCEKIEERLVSNSVRDEQRCSCEHQEKLQEIIPDTFNFALKGNWYKNNKSY